MSAGRRLARLEERIRALGTICRTCHSRGPDLLLAWEAEKEGRDPVKTCPDCGRPGRFRFGAMELAMDWREIIARRRTRSVQSGDESTSSHEESP